MPSPPHPFSKLDSAQDDPMKRTVGLVRRRKALLDRLITATVGLGEVIELQKNNGRQRQQLEFISRRLRLRQENGRWLPEQGKKLNRSHLKALLDDQKYLEKDRRELAEKAKHFRDMIKANSVKLTELG